MHPTPTTEEPYERAPLWGTEYATTSAADTLPWETNPTPYGPFGNQQDEHTTGRWRQPVWLSAVVGVIAIWRLISALAGAGRSPDAGWGVHVCEHVDYSSSDAQCTHDDTLLTLGGGSYGPRLSFSGVNGATFSSAPVTFTIKVQDSRQRVVAQGTATVDVSTTDNAGAVRLDSMLLSAGIDPEPLGDYHIDVRQGTANLGSASFTVLGISPSSTGGDSSGFVDGSFGTGNASDPGIN